jgi:hypothetical protein
VRAVQENTEEPATEQGRDKQNDEKRKIYEKRKHRPYR